MSSGFFILILIAFLLIWLFLIRPQRRRQSDQLSMQENLAAGDEIVTAGGMYGTVAAVDEDEVALEVADGVVVRIARRAVAGVIPPDEAEEDAEELEDESAAREAEREEAKLEPR